MFVSTGFGLTPWTLTDVSDVGHRAADWIAAGCRQQQRTAVAGPRQTTLEFTASLRQLREAQAESEPTEARISHP